MGKAGKRRNRHVATHLAEMARIDKKRFHFEWNRRLDGWLAEINRRAKLLRVDKAHELASKRVFGVLEHVNELLAQCGPDVEALVGASTRDTITHECCKALALAVAPNLYRLTTKA